MTLAVARIGDKFLDNDAVAVGSTDVFANNIGVARMTDMTTGHTDPPDHGLYPPVPITTGSGSVFVNNLPVARLTDKHAVHCDPHPDCHDSVISTASGNVFSG